MNLGNRKPIMIERKKENPNPEIDETLTKRYSFYYRFCNFLIS